jgi:hypothetical protein
MNGYVRRVGAVRIYKHSLHYAPNILPVLGCYGFFYLCFFSNLYKYFR